MLFKKSQLGWHLLCQSLAVLQEWKKLWILSLIGRGFFFLILTSITVLAWALRMGKIDYQSLSTKQIAWGYVIVLLALWIGNIVSAYFNAALTACLIQVENYQKISLRQGLRSALSQFWIIFSWILAHFTLGPMIMIFQSKLEEYPRINQLLSGLSWVFAAFMVPPLIIHEPAGFFRTLKRSSQLMRTYAGKQPRINYSYTWISLGLRFVSLIPMSVGYHLNQPVWIALGIVISFILLLGVVVMFNATLAIIHHALYQYIAHGKTTPHFNTKELAVAIAPVEP